MQDLRSWPRIGRREKRRQEYRRRLTPRWPPQPPPKPNYDHERRRRKTLGSPAWYTYVGSPLSAAHQSTGSREKALRRRWTRSLSYCLTPSRAAWNRSRHSRSTTSSRGGAAAPTQRTCASSWARSTRPSAPRATRSKATMSERGARSTQRENRSSRMSTERRKPCSASVCTSPSTVCAQWRLNCTRCRQCFCLV